MYLSDSSCKIVFHNLKIYGLKKLSGTHWKPELGVIKQLIISYVECTMLWFFLVDNTKQSNSATSHKTTTLGRQSKDFLDSLFLIWNDTFFQVNVVRKANRMIFGEHLKWILSNLLNVLVCKSKVSIKLL